MLAVPAPELLPIADARLGVLTAWDTLFRRYQLPIFTYVHELVRDEQASFDLVQETFISAVRHIDGLREDEKFPSWLFGIAHQKCIQRWRRDRRSESIVEELSNAPAEWAESPDELMIKNEDASHFMAQLNQLPLAQRSALLLHFVEDFSLEEIVEITGAQIGTVKSRIHYGKRALKKLMEETKK